MKAARIHRFGGPEVIQIEDIADPQATGAQLRIRVAACSVNPVDYKIRQGGFMPEDKLPLTLGRDVAGTVDQLGSDGDGRFKVGDQVFAHLPFDTGGNAGFAVVAAGLCAPKPRPLDAIQAGALGLAAMTAWQGLFDHGGLQAGQRVLIHGAAGGVGHIAVQLACARGAEVVATCGADDVAFVRALGASIVIDYQAERFEGRAHDIDVVYDLIGGETHHRSWAVLKRGGILVSTLTEPDKTKAAAHGARGAHYMAQPDGATLRRVADLVEAGKLRPTVSQVLPLERIAEAHRVLEQGHVRGKIVLTVAS